MTLKKKKNGSKNCRFRDQKKFGMKKEHDENLYKNASNMLLNENTFKLWEFLSVFAQCT